MPTVKRLITSQNHSFQATQETDPEICKWIPPSMGLTQPKEVHSSNLINRKPVLLPSRKLTSMKTYNNKMYENASVTLSYGMYVVMGF